MRNVENESHCSHIFFSSNFFFCSSVSLAEDAVTSLGAKVTRKLVVASVEEGNCLEGGAEVGPL